MRLCAQRLIATDGGGAKALVPETRAHSLADIWVSRGASGDAGIWRPRPELNRGAQICSLLRHHSATWPRCAAQRVSRSLPAWQCPGLPRTRGFAAIGCSCRPRRCWQPGRRLGKVRRNCQARDESAMTDTTQQRINMVDSQVRPSDVTDRRIIKAMLEVPREAFAPADMHALAYMDQALPVMKAGAAGPARTLLAPRTLAKMLQLAGVEPDCTVLDVGCGPATRRPCWASLPARWWRWRPIRISPSAPVRPCGKLDVAGAKVVQGPLAAGVPDEAPFDAILLNGAVPEVPQALLDQLKDGGRLVAIVAPSGYGRAQVWRRTGRSFGNVTAFDAAADPLPGFAREPGFVF